jgi:dolichyl-phosphate beta-glucosyltransferase
VSEGKRRDTASAAGTAVSVADKADDTIGALKLSVVIPMYNESARLAASMPKLVEYFARQTYPYEIVVVDDGSKDGTPALAIQLLSSLPMVRVISQQPNRGKGAAVKTGMLAAKGAFVMFCDADLATPPSELDKFWPILDRGYEVVIGSRKMPGANIVRHQPIWRESLGKVFTWLTDKIATHNISDVTCGFKCFSHSAAQQIFSRSVLTDWSFDAEVLFIAQKRGYRIKEVPVTWHDEPGTKVRIVRDATQALLGLLKIRRNYMRGVYK